MSSPTDLPAPLEDGLLDADPHVQFTEWMDHARRSGAHEPEAMTLATADVNGVPSARLVLLRRGGHDGYVWFTNYDSRKGRELAENPRAALVFHWPAVGRQIRIEGRVERTSAAESDEYFGSRHPDSQIGAWASAQSSPLTRREDLLRRVEECERRFGDGPVPRPPGWGGYVLHADALEFWQHRESRLHDRFRYERSGDGWAVTRLSP